MNAPMTLVGHTYGKLTVVSQAEWVLLSGRLRVAWNCTCACGGKVAVTAVALRSERGRKSCGCLMQESMEAFWERRKATKTPESIAQKKREAQARFRLKPQFLANQRARYADRRDDEIASTMVRQSAAIANLSDSYVRGLIAQGTDLKAEDIPQELIELKRVLVQSKRLLDEKC